MRYQDQIKYNKQFFYNLPKEINRQDYLNACDYITKKFSRYNFIESIYLAGGNWLPGISDLDIYIVFKDNEKINFWQNPKETKPQYFDFIVSHSHDFFNSSSFKFIYYIFSKQASFKLLYVKEQEIIDPEQDETAEEYQFMQLSIITDFLINKLLHFFQLKRDNYIDVRSTIGELYSLKYTYKLLEETFNIQLQRSFINKIEQLRSNWFGQNFGNNIKDLTSVINDSENELYFLIDTLDQYLKKSKFYITNQKVFHSNQYEIKFIERENWSGELFKKEFNRGYINFILPIRKTNILFYQYALPISISSVFVQYASAENVFSSYFKVYKKNLDEEQVSKGIKKRVEAIGSLYEFINSNNYYFRTPFSYGFNLKRGKSKLILYNLTKGLKYPAKFFE